jgi:hypothetical protein
MTAGACDEQQEVKGKSRARRAGEEAEGHESNTSVS